MRRLSSEDPDNFLLLRSFFSSFTWEDARFGNRMSIPSRVYELPQYQIDLFNTNLTRFDAEFKIYSSISSRKGYYIQFNSEDGAALFLLAFK